MRSKIATVAALIGVAFLSGACATSEQWAEWRAHTTHFASGDHGMFSLSNNMDGKNARVTRLDVENSRLRTGGARPSRWSPVRSSRTRSA